MLAPAVLQRAQDTKKTSPDFVSAGLFATPVDPVCRPALAYPEVAARSLISDFTPIREIYSLFRRNYEIKFLYKINRERILAIQQPILYLALGKAELLTTNGEDTK
ncbi:hypothetical protein EHI47_19650 [Rhizobium leguminosarum]|jgi:hypothetical protein|uniref:Uncharacterized protein n=2 Tax=Rhizobium TaxID=379 RepID=A0A444HWR4_RHILE|nr:hypothetical protein EHI45_19230 [Rhizobium leguminosarum]TBE60182.1 hypothetical protein ELH03_31500 [Rhizobium beringeri]RWX28350.1 hypothetical protein EHI47_19650 [Rhizobium leguminosarum]TAU44199.1 hypothetical protein ELI43_29880 [Rhizobium leguminosarum]TBC60984.1 hypothetical protein ELH27_31265 [Rhizobium leguminosarum]